MSRPSRLEPLPAAALLFGVVFLFIPAGVCAANGETAGWGLALPALLLSLAWLSCAAACALLPPRAHPWLAGAATYVWLNSFFGYGDMKGVLDGKNLAFSAPSPVDVLALAASVGLAAAVVRAWGKRRASVNLFFLVILAGNLAYALAVCVKSRPASDRIAGMSEIAAFSRTSNVLVIVLDSFQSDVFEEIEKTRPDLMLPLEGFSFFPKAVGVAPSTYLSLPTIHSGRTYDESRSSSEFTNEAIGTGSFLSRLAAGGYDAHLVNPIGGKCPAGAACSSLESAVYPALEKSLYASLCALGLSALRLAPPGLKKRVFGGILALSSRHFSIGVAHAASDRFLRGFSGALTVGDRKPAARMVHLYSTHQPAYFDEDCRPVEPVPAWERAPVTAQSICAVKRVGALLSRMKEAGTYDNTDVVILGDHGSGIARDRSGSMQELIANASPLLLVKPRKARGPLKSSLSLVSLEDVPQTVCALAGVGAVPRGLSVFSERNKAPRDFRFNDYAAERGQWDGVGVEITRAFRIRGDPRDPGSWRRLEHGPR